MQVDVSVYIYTPDAVMSVTGTCKCVTAPTEVHLSVRPHILSAVSHSLTLHDETPTPDPDFHVYINT